MNVHYLNASSKPIGSAVTITIRYVKRDAVKTHVGTMLLNNTFFSVPAGISKASPQTYTKSNVPLRTDYALMTSWSHMHRWGTDFRAQMNGKTFYEEKAWDEPQLFQHSPPLSVKGGTSISWSCEYYNDTGKTLSFGESQNDVMCIYFSWYYPADPSNPGIINVLQ